MAERVSEVGFKLNTKEFQGYIKALGKEERKDLRKLVVREAAQTRTQVRRAYRIGLKTRSGKLWKSFVTLFMSRLFKRGVIGSRVSSFYFTSLWMEEGWNLTTRARRQADRRLIRVIQGRFFLRDIVRSRRAATLTKVEDSIQSSMNRAARIR